MREWIDADPDGPRSHAVRATATAYIALCEDDLALRSRGWITRQTFSVWADGMESQLSIEPYQSAYAYAVAESDAGHGQPYVNLRRFVANPTDLRRLPMSATRARIREFIGL